MLTHTCNYTVLGRNSTSTTRSLVQQSTVVQELVRPVFLIGVDLRTGIAGWSFIRSAITQFYVSLVPATSEQIQLGGDNYRLKRLNPAGYRFAGL